MPPHSRWLRFCGWPSIAILLLALIATLLAGCGVSTAGSALPVASPIASLAATSLPTPAPTLTPAPARPLQWQTRAVPAPLGLTSLAFSPLNSALVWMCAPTASGATVWVSHDRAASWHQVSTVQAGNTVTFCTMTPDDLDPATAVLQMASGAGGIIPIRPYPMHVTHDGGKTWIVFPAPKDTLHKLSTFHGATYALFALHPGSMSPWKSTFVVSRDGMQSWQPLDRALATPNSTDASDYRYVRDYWLDPLTGNMLAKTASALTLSVDLYSSDDGGATWRDLHTPSANDYVVRQPYAATAAWEMCGLRVSAGTSLPGWPKAPICSVDSGESWTSRSAASPEDVNAFALANDGAILAGDSHAVFRALPTGGAWNSLGTAPASGAFLYLYQPGTGVGVIWAIPQSQVVGPVTRVYIASYA